MGRGEFSDTIQAATLLEDALLDGARERIILHSDINNCYASIETLRHPELKDVPMAVAGSPEDRHGIILAKNEIAKRYKVKTGEAIWQAREKCPQLVLVPGDYDYYAAVCSEVRSIYQRYTDQVEDFGMDECWLDCTGSQKLFGTGLEIAEAIAADIRREIGLTVSIGIANNKVFAKLGSSLRKPDAITLVPREAYATLIDPLPVEMLLGVGPATERKLKKVGVHTIGQLGRLSPDFLYHYLGKNGLRLGEFARGIESSDVRVYGMEEPILSIGRGQTTRVNMENEAQVSGLLRELAQEVGARLREAELLATGVALSIRDSELYDQEFQASLGFETHSGTLLAEAGMKLLQENYRWERPLRAITLRAIRLQDSSRGRQLSFDPGQRIDRHEQLDLSVEGIRQRFGPGSIYYASSMKYAELFPRKSCRIPMPSGWHAG